MHYDKLSVLRLGTTNEFGIPKKNSDRFVIISCSNIIKIKRIDLIIKSLSLLKFDFKWIHIGDGPLFDELNQLSKQIFVNDNNFNF